MFRILLLLFLTIPLIEIYLLIQVGSVIGALPTVAIVILTAIIGAYLLRVQGISTIQRVQETMARGEIPAIEMLEGLVLIITGALLLTPGFFTDTIGFLLLIPAVRRKLIVGLLKHMTIITPGGPRGPGGPHRGPEIIDGEYRRED